MEKIEWNETLRIGVEELDKAHVNLFRIVGKLLDISKDPAARPGTYKEVIKYLEAYTMTHFSEEEAYMRSVRYEGYARHKKIHDDFRDKILVSFKKDLEQSGYSVEAVHRFVRTLNGWLTNHIMNEDQAITGKAGAQKQRDFSSQAAILSRAMDRAAQDIFQMEAKLVSTDYKGHNIGNGFYCRQWYDIEEKIRLQLLLGAEEALILRGASRGQGVRKEKITRETVLQVFEELFRQIGKVFRAEPEHRLNKNNLLDKDGFRADFMKGYSCRLLFSTKAGYIILCYRSWKVSSQKNKAS